MKRKDKGEKTKALGGDAAERIGAIVEAAERAAASIIDDAEAEARRYLADAVAEADRIVAERLTGATALSDGLIAEAEEIRTRSERLLDAIERAKAELAAGAGSAPPSVPSQANGPSQPSGPGASSQPSSRGSHLSAVAPVGEAPVIEEAPVPTEPVEPSSPPEDRNSGASPAGARLLATQMAVSGNSREEIEARLRNGFEIEDTTSILDAILGPEES